MHGGRESFYRTEPRASIHYPETPHEVDFNQAFTQLVAQQAIHCVSLLFSPPRYTERNLPQETLITTRRDWNVALSENILIGKLFVLEMLQGATHTFWPYHSRRRHA